MDGSTEVIRKNTHRRLWRNLKLFSTRTNLTFSSVWWTACGGDEFASSIDCNPRREKICLWSVRRAQSLTEVNNSIGKVIIVAKGMTAFWVDAMRWQADDIRHRYQVNIEVKGPVHT